MAATATSGQLDAAAKRSRVFLVKKMERGQADVGDFFFAKHERLRRREVCRLLHVRGRHRRSGRAPRQRKSQTDGP
jgi:hypothetical protein